MNENMSHSIIGDFGSFINRQFSDFGWFFVRYQVNRNFELRVRVNCPSDRIQELTVDLLKYFMEQKRLMKIHSITQGHYVPEINRYLDIEVAEKIFSAESAFLSDYLTSADYSFENNLKIVFLYVDSQFDCFSVPIGERLIIARSSENAYTKEFPGLSRQTIKSYIRKHRNQFLDGSYSLSKPLLTQVEFFLQELRVNAHSRFDRSSFLSHIHMFCNRIFSHEQRLQEFLFYSLYASIQNSKIKMNNK